MLSLLLSRTNRSRLVTYLALFFLVVTWTPVAADERSGKEGEGRAERSKDDLFAALDQRIELSLLAAAPRDVFAGIAEILGVPLEIDDDVARPITIQVSRARVRHVLDVLCDMADCQWHAVPDLLLVTDLEPPPAAPSSDAPFDQLLNLSLRDAALCETLRTFGKVNSIEVVIDEEICRGGETVTFAAESMSQRKLLDEICRIHDCRWRLDDAGRLVFER